MVMDIISSIMISQDIILKRKKREQMELYALTECSLFISETGGCQYFGLYAEKTLLINYFPINFPHPSPKKNKQIIDLNNNKIAINKKINYKEEMEMLINNKDLILENKKPHEILNFVKENINN